MKRFCFVILHYGKSSIQDTYECIDTLIEILDKELYQIIVVDNGSPDTSYDDLLKKYSRESQVDVVKSTINLGFAQGNNLGCKYAIKRFNPAFLIVLNNDTVVVQDNILEIIESEYNTNAFHILGPDILDINNTHQNPIAGNILETLEQVEREIDATKRLLMKLRNYGVIQKTKYLIIDKMLRFKLIKKIWNKLKQKNRMYINHDKPLWNIPLHGSALIFSKDYFTKYRDWIFYPDTFLYAEEDILYYIASRDRLKLRYLPKIKVFHKEDSSTNCIVNGKLEKILFTSTHKLNSLNVFKSLIESDTDLNNNKEKE